MTIGKVASHNDLGGYISHWLETTVWILLTFGEVSRQAYNKPLLFKRRGLEGLYVFVDPSKRGLGRNII